MGFFIYMNNTLKEKIHNYCYQIKTGKPVANIAVQNRYIVEAKQIINENKLRYFIEFLYVNWSSLWIYKKEFMIEIIKALPDNPKTIFDQWVLGKAFGYTDEAIEDFLGNLSE